MGAKSEIKSVSWHRYGRDDIDSPVVREVPYVEVTLEHPHLEPTGQIDRFFPAAVPYRADENARVFFWQPILDPAAPDSNDWIAACATTLGFVGIDGVPASVPSVVVDDVNTDGVGLVVTGTIVGEAEIAWIRSYHPPSLQITEVLPEKLVLSVDGEDRSITSGSRRQLDLPSQAVVFGEDESSQIVSPELEVRYPGIRELHHPAIGTSDRLFPSFGLDLDCIPNPLHVPTKAGELDHGALAARLGIDRSERPYAERVLWQAFAYSAFDPHRDSPPVIEQGADGHIVLRDVDGE